jgi:threonine dehydrogenase-like Zn-dependent dehydrogenase
MKITLQPTARKLGPVIGKTVAVVGQGQNGLIATRLMSQFAAKAVIAVCPSSDVYFHVLMT